MHKEQLTEAFQLMKSGDKEQALVIVKRILREDTRNVNAWWMMSHLLDDEDKVVKSLEKILSIDPNHQIARKKLAKLRPEYSNLVADDTFEAKSLKKDLVSREEISDDSYWHKLSKPPKHKGGKWERWIKEGFEARVKFLGVMAIIILIAGVIFVIGSLFTGFPEVSMPNLEPSVDINGNTPQDAIRTFLHADLIQDADALYMITCPELFADVQSIINDFDDYYPAANVDFSETIFEIEHYDYRNERAYVTINGITHYSGGGVTATFNWRDAARSEGYDFYGEFVHKIDGRWLVCTGYNVPHVDTEN